jgi:uncharacterized protein
VPTYLRPGVYLEEVPHARGPRPVARVLPPSFDDGARHQGPRWMAEHTHAAFIGLAEQGPIEEPVWVHGWTQYLSLFGDMVQDAALAHAVYGFFANGGQSCVVVRADPENLAAGFTVLEDLDDVSIVCAPDIMSRYQAGSIDLDGVRALQLALLAHCEALGDRIGILDCPPGLTTQQVRDWRIDHAGYDSSFATLYYPWIRVFDPATGRNRLVPPCGHVAGVFASVDLMRGFHHSPANQVVEGAVGLDRCPTPHEQELLNPVGINTFVVSAGRGVVVWGSRTLSTDPALRYIHRRRLTCFLLRNIRKGTQWAIFRRMDDPMVRPRLVAEVTDFLTLLWRSGALWGDTPEEAFWVGVDDSAEIRDIRCLRLHCGARVERDFTIEFRLLYFCD